MDDGTPVREVRETSEGIIRAAREIMDDNVRWQKVKIEKNKPQWRQDRAICNRVGNECSEGLSTVNRAVVKVWNSN